MSLTEITTHSDQAVDRLHGKHKGKANIESFLRILIDPIQDIETVLIQLDTERLIGTAIGEQLNVLGRVVGQLRDGLSNDDYRRFIRARIAANKSKGRWEDLIVVTRLILAVEAAVLVMSESDFMTVLMEVTEAVVSDALADILIGFMADTKSDVVRVLLTYSAQVAADTFTYGSYTQLSGNTGIGDTTLPVDSTAGFADAGDLIVDIYDGSEDAISYTGKDATTFLGVTGLASTHSTNDSVQTGDSAAQGFEDNASPGTGGQFASVVVSERA